MTHLQGMWVYLGISFALGNDGLGMLALGFLVASIVRFGCGLWEAWKLFSKDKLP